MQAHLRRERITPEGSPNDCWTDPGEELGIRIFRWSGRFDTTADALEQLTAAERLTRKRNADVLIVFANPQQTEMRQALADYQRRFLVERKGDKYTIHLRKAAPRG